MLTHVLLLLLMLLLLLLLLLHTTLLVLAFLLTHILSTSTNERRIRSKRDERTIGKGVDGLRRREVVDFL
jgi:hypothetical protein